MTDVIPDPIQVAARTRTDAPAVITPDEVVTYADFDQRVARVAAGLSACGLRQGDRLAIYRSVDVDYLILLFAALRVGVAACPLNTRYPEATLPRRLQHIGCRALVAEGCEAWDGVSVLNLDTIAADAGEDSEVSWRLAAPATLIFTSGSTGDPKAALHTVGNHIWSARGLMERIPLAPDDRWLLDLPLYHVGGLAILFRCALAGAAVVLPATDDLGARTIARHSVTHVSFVATQLGRLLRAPDIERQSSLKTVLLGGSAIPPGLLDEAVARGLPVHTSYGMTEMTSTVTVTPPAASRQELDTSGTLLSHREVMMASDGEVMVRGATLFSGYVEGRVLRRPDAHDGWFPTGDLGAWEEVGGKKMLRIIGRKDNLFISGGENVQPEEIESALGAIRGVQRAVVVPVENAEFGYRPVAFVAAEGWEPDGWCEALAAELPRFKVPEVFYPWPEEMEGSIKVHRRALQAAAQRVSPQL